MPFDCKILFTRRFASNSARLPKVPMSRLSEFALNKEDYTKGPRELGHGTFGVVYEGVYRRNGANLRVAVKEPKDPNEGQQNVMRELGILASINHPTLLRLVGVHLAGDDIGPTILTPLMENGDLGKILRDELHGKRIPGWNPTTKTICVFGIAVGMAYLHSKGIIHRDLKPHNVFVNDAFEPVIADFGLSRCFAISMTGRVGSPLYMAPELMRPDPLADNFQYTGKVDVYSYAMSVLDILYPVPTRIWDDHRPITISTLYRRVLNGARPQRPDKASDEWWTLITRSWHPLPAERPSFAEILEEFMFNTEAYCLPGADVAAVRAYLDRVTQGLTFVDATKVETDDGYRGVESPASSQDREQNHFSFMELPDDDD